MSSTLLKPFIPLRNLYNVGLNTLRYRSRYVYPFDVTQYKDLEPPPTYDHIVMPEYRKLPVMPKVPTYFGSQKPPKLRLRHLDVKGPELIQNKLLHKQYGIISLSGSYMQYSHFEMIRTGINKEMDTRNTFAVWRVDPPWKPVTKKSIGKRMGGGKGNVHHYSTPVKAGRIVLEIGGKVEYEEVFPFLERVAAKLPFHAMPVSQEILEKLEVEARHQVDNNINPFSFSYAVRNNVHGCRLWAKPMDYYYDGKYSEQ